MWPARSLARRATFGCLMHDNFRPTRGAAPNQRHMAREHDPAAVTHAEREFDALAEEFFSRESLHPFEMNADDEPELTRISSKRAMRVTLVTLAISTATVGSFLAYMHLIMPVPAELGPDSALQPAHDGVLVTQPASAAESSIPVTSTTSPAPGPQPRLAAPASEADEPTGAISPAAPPLASIESAPPAQSVADAKPVRIPAVSPAQPTHRTNRRHAHDLVDQAYASLNRGDAAAALSQARAAVAIFPTRADAWIVLGSAYDALRDHANARDAFRTCVRRASGQFVTQCRVLARD
jgi:hypothetical protein